jgi:murein peptide amidase A
MVASAKTRVNLASSCLASTDSTVNADVLSGTRLLSPTGRSARLIILVEGHPVATRGVSSSTGISLLSALLDQDSGAFSVLREVCTSYGTMVEGQSVTAVLIAGSRIALMTTSTRTRWILIRDRHQVELDPVASVIPASSARLVAGDRIAIGSSLVARCFVDELKVLGETPQIQNAVDQLAETFGARVSSAPVSVILIEAVAVTSSGSSGIPDDLRSILPPKRLVVPTEHSPVVAAPPESRGTGRRFVRVGAVLVCTLALAAGIGISRRSAPVGNARGAISTFVASRRPLATSTSTTEPASTSVEANTVSPTTEFLPASTSTPTATSLSLLTTVPPSATPRASTLKPANESTQTTARAGAPESSWGTAALRADCAAIEVGSLPVASQGWAAIGVSVQDRQIRARIEGSGPRKVLWVGGVHGDEAEGRTVTERLATEFISTPALGTKSTLMIIEDTNPDGRAAGTRENSRGVDLNRNFPAANFEPSKNHGATQLSEPEAQALAQAVCTFQPDVVMVSHSGHSKELKNAVDPDGPADALAEAFGATAGMSVANASYPTPGSFGTWAGNEGQLQTLTVEFARGLDPIAAWEQAHNAVLNAIAG